MKLIRDGKKGGKGVWGWGKREITYLSLHCHHQNDSCIKMGSDESHFNVSLFVKDKVTRQCPQTTILDVKGELKQIRTEVPLLTSLPPYRQTGSHFGFYWKVLFMCLTAIRHFGRFLTDLQAPPLSSQAFPLTITWYCVDGWNRGPKYIIIFCMEYRVPR